MRAAAEHGKVVLVGSPPGTAHLGLQVDLLRRELDVRGSYGNVHDAHRYYRWTQRRDRDSIMRMMESGELEVNHLISHVADPVEADELYQKIVEGPAGWMGVFFDWTLVEQPGASGS
jgi:threonine dehydrogenase-like Zn-dependent dehydrogenase